MGVGDEVEAGGDAVVGVGKGSRLGVTGGEDPVELSVKMVADALVFDCTSPPPPQEPSMKAMANTLMELVLGDAVRSLDIRQIVTDLPYQKVSANGKFAQ